MKRGLFLTCIMVVIVFGAIGSRARATSGGGGGGCEEDWTACLRPAHAGCTATCQVDGGPPIYIGDQYLWRGHIASYMKLSNSDIDCHQTADCTYTDAAEDRFACTWGIQKLGYGWEDVANPGFIWADCTGALWDTGYAYTGSVEPNRTYRAVCKTYDTPEDGPGGVDFWDWDPSQEKIVWGPAPENFQVAQGFPVCEQDGVWTWKFTWTSNCGHVAHLDLVTVRERVMWDCCTSNEIHDLTHAGATCFYGGTPDPHRKGVSGAQGYFDDMLLKPLIVGRKYSECVSHQVYQFAWHWPNPPSDQDDTAGWCALEDHEHEIHRYVIQPGGQWYYRIEKANEQFSPCSRPLP